MKKLFSIIKIMMLVGILATSFTSCHDFIATESDRLTLADDNLINSPNDTVYSVLGLLKQLQTISDNYVLLGELRGDLMDATDLADTELRDLSEFKVDASTSRFSKTKDFYAIINNCNYLINKADTNLIVGTRKPFAKEVLIAKSIRAWTYLQIVMNYGKVQFFKTPILTYNEAVSDYPELNQEEMIDALIADFPAITPTTEIELPFYGSIGDVSSEKLYINTKFLLGDLYLWKASFSKNKADYEMAARYYANLIDDENYLIRKGSSVKWRDDSFTETSNAWRYSIMSTGTSEMISTIQLADNIFEGTTTELNNLSRDLKINISEAFKKIAQSQTYCIYTKTNSTETRKYNDGDLRAIGSTLETFIFDGSTLSLGELKREVVIGKYTQRNIALYRMATLFLRYAEAVNRAGKPGLSYAVLKYGLNKLNIEDPTKIPASEVAGNIDYVSMFTQEKFNSPVVGIHDRGSGNSDHNDLFVIPDFTRYLEVKVLDGAGVPLVSVITNKDSVIFVPTTDIAKQMEAKTDSIDFVEKSICTELALETGLEGNRFQDLMRFSIRRDDNSFLADRVAAKHTNNTAAIKNLLMDRKNWFVPTK